MKRKLASLREAQALGQSEEEERNINADAACGSALMILMLTRDEAALFYAAVL